MEKLNEYQVFNDNRRYAPIIDHRKKPKKRLNWTFIVAWTSIVTVMCFLIKTLYNLIN
jgi:hypothetical protein